MLFCPFTFANNFTWSWIRPDTVVLKEINLKHWDLPSLKFALHEGKRGENRNGGKYFGIPAYSIFTWRCICICSSMVGQISLMDFYRGLILTQLYNISNFHGFYIHYFCFNLKVIPVFSFIHLLEFQGFIAFLDLQVVWVFIFFLFFSIREMLPEKHYKMFGKWLFLFSHTLILQSTE